MSPTFHESFAAFKTINAIYNLVDLTSREQQDASKMKKIIKQILHTAKISEDAPLLFSFKARFYFIRLAEVSCEFQHDEFDKKEQFSQRCLQFFDEAIGSTPSFHQYKVCLLHLRRGDLSKTAKCAEKIESCYYQSLIQGYIVRHYQQEGNIFKALKEAKKIKLEPLRRCLLEKIFNQMIH